ncbi:MAG: hypothetical protein WC728_19085 [Elusimicrobiota bacterium]
MCSPGVNIIALARSSLMSYPWIGRAMEQISHMKEPPQGQDKSQGKLKIFIIVGAALVLLLCALFVLMNKGGGAPAEPEPIAQAVGFSESIARPETRAVPLEAPPSSRQPQSHLFAPIADDPASKSSEASGTARQEGEVDEFPGDKPAVEQETEPKTAAEAQQGRKLDSRSMDSGSRTQSFGGGADIGAGGFTAPASGGLFRPEAGLREKEKFSGARESVSPEPFAQPADARRSRLMRRTTGTGQASEPKPSRRIEAFKKDPKGERQSDEVSVKPGWVQMDNGQYIHVMEMVGTISEGGKTISPAQTQDQTGVLKQLE